MHAAGAAPQNKAKKGEKRAKKKKKSLQSWRVLNALCITGVFFCFTGGGSYGGGVFVTRIALLAADGTKAGGRMAKIEAHVAGIGWDAHYIAIDVLDLVKYGRHRVNGDRRI